MLDLASASLDEIAKHLASLSEAEREALAKQAAADARVWFPNPGPQRDAYYSPADVLLYGGSGGSGKTDLGLGLAFTQHRRSLILRRRYVDLAALLDRAIEIHESQTGVNRSPPPRLVTKDGRLIQFGANQHLGDEAAFQGQPFDLKVFDEASAFLEQQVRFHLGWLRSTDPGQRVRAVLATNPPTSSDGDWIIKFFRSWLDLTHPNPAGHGELRWFVTAPDGEDLEVDGPQPVVMDGRTLKPTSRTFIPGKLADNPYLARTDYASRLDALPEPLRSAIRDGRFGLAREEPGNQIIPLAWVLEAESRWTANGGKGTRMTAMAVDAAGGGPDATTIAWRHGPWFAPVIGVKGEQTRDPQAATVAIFVNRRDNCPVVVDSGGGYGGAILTRLADQGIPTHRFNGAERAAGHAGSTSLSFANARAAAWWTFREALDPDQPDGSPIALPPDPELRADLTAPVYDLRAAEVRSALLVESKEELRKRLGRSPDKGDAVVMAWFGGAQAVRREDRKARAKNLPSFAKRSGGPLGRRAKQRERRN
jgi:hypothetical protein